MSHLISRHWAGGGKCLVGRHHQTIGISDGSRTGRTRIVMACSQKRRTDNDIRGMWRPLLHLGNTSYAATDRSWQSLPSYGARCSIDAWALWRLGESSPTQRQSQWGRISRDGRVFTSEVDIIYHDTAAYARRKSKARPSEAIKRQIPDGRRCQIIRAAESPCPVDARDHGLDQDPASGPEARCRWG